MAANPSEPFVEKLFSTKEELIAALHEPDFYIELLFIGIALTVAWLMATLIRRSVTRRLDKSPPRRIDKTFLLKSLSLVGPILALIYLGAVRPFTREYANGEQFIQAAVQLCFAYLLVTCVMLLVRTKPIARFIAFIIMVTALLDVSGFTESTVAALSATTFGIGKFRISLLNIIHGLIIFVLVFWLAGVISRTLESYLRRSSSLSYNARELIVKFFTIFVYFIAFMITLSATGVDLTALAVFGGALGVGVGLGLQKITSNFVSGVTLLIERSIKLGDLIEVGGVTGWVRQLNIRYALIETFDGRELLVPNEELITTRVTNWTYSTDLARVEIRVSISYQSDALNAQHLMLKAASEHPLCLKKPEPICTLREFGDAGLIFIVNFWIPNIRDGRVVPQSEVMFAILKKFKEAGIEIPYPRYDVTLKNESLSI